MDEGHAAAYLGGGKEEEGGEAGDKLIDRHVRQGAGEGGEGWLEDSARVPQLGMLLGGTNEVADAVFGEASFLFPKEGEGLGRQLPFLFYLDDFCVFGVGGVLWCVPGKERG